MLRVAYRFVAIGFACGFAAGCASAPIVETKAFSDSVKTLDTAGNQLLLDLSIAERKLGKARAVQRLRTANRIIESRNGVILTSLDPAEASYFATIGDPPDVKIFKHAFRVIVTYADTLLALVDGRDTAAQQAQIGELVNSVSALATAIGAVPGPSATAGALLPVLREELSPVIGQILAARNRAEAKALVLRTAPAIRNLIDALRRSAPAMVGVLTDNAVNALAAAAKARTSTATPVSTAQAYVTQVANYVLLLDQMRDAFDALVIAYQQPDNVISLATVVQRSNELSTDVSAFQKVWAELRARNL